MSDSCSPVQTSHRIPDQFTFMNSPACSVRKHHEGAPCRSQMTAYVISSLDKLRWLVLIIGFISQGWLPAPSLILVATIAKHLANKLIIPAETGWVVTGKINFHHFMVNCLNHLQVLQSNQTSRGHCEQDSIVKIQSFPLKETFLCRFILKEFCCGTSIFRLIFFLFFFFLLQLCSNVGVILNRLHWIVMWGDSQSCKVNIIINI